MLGIKLETSAVSPVFLIAELLPQSLSFYFLYFSKYHSQYIIMSLMVISEISIFAWGRVSLNYSGWSWTHSATSTSSERTNFLQWFHQEPWYQTWNVKPVFLLCFAFSCRTSICSSGVCHYITWNQGCVPGRASMQSLSPWPHSSLLT